MFSKCLLLFIGFALTRCETDGDRKPKLFSFDADKEDLQVGLDFSLPFIKIPIKSSASSSSFAAHDFPSLPKIQVNLSSLIVGGLVFLVTSFVSPLLNKPYHRSSRYNTEPNPLLGLSEQIIERNSGCLERFACLSSQRRNDIQYIRSIKRIMRNEVLSSIVNTTALDEATNHGLRGNDCLGYEPCSVSEEDFKKITDNLPFMQKSKNT